MKTLAEFLAHHREAIVPSAEGPGGLDLLLDGTLASLRGGRFDAASFASLPSTAEPGQRLHERIFDLLEGRGRIGVVLATRRPAPHAREPSKSSQPLRRC